MAFFPTKHLLIVTIFLLCFISTSTQARKLSMKIPQSPNIASAKGKEKVARKEDQVQDNMSEELAMIDYSPARRKTPIHN
ncbi:hypothetical protein C2S53_014460 [Perilla frutescens var. hirtella]|uniref:Uncharacterized protein n=1 Tax=Perilla frutescens var. hirtella TaxID=608512 RepID=A0AAD4JKL1_PERFH|nr:hypothetical protein C2S53_014460 [Perilla frutescens var. hirtella]